MLKYKCMCTSKEIYSLYNWQIKPKSISLVAQHTRNILNIFHLSIIWNIFINCTQMFFMYVNVAYAYLT